MSLRAEFEMLLEAIAQQDQLEIETESEGGTAEELLRRTDNGQQEGDKLSWGSSGRANPKGYCQHATSIADANHLSYKNELTGSL